jgi:DNA-directed RNA polymerase subunit RPC12/RpoP
MMDMYFCPRCGQRYEADECLDEGGLLRCPQCRTPRVLVAGRILIATGLVIAMLSAMIFPPFVIIGGVVLGGALCVTGLARSIRQRRAGRRSDLEDSYMDEM